MLRYSLKRIAYIVFVFIIVSMIQFGIYQMVPGDPVALQLQDQLTVLTPEQYQLEYDMLKQKMGLDKSIPEQYFIWFTNMIKGDFGRSSVHKTEVISLVQAPLKNTVTLNIVTLVLVFSITIPLGIATAVRKNSLFDKVVQVGTIIGYSLPGFVVSLVAIVLFAVLNPIFPISGSSTPNFVGTPMEEFLDKLHYMALPVIVMTLTSLGTITRYVRACMIEALKMDYIRTARSKGLREKVVIYSHAFRNSLIPVVTILTGWFVGIFGGSVVIESIFLWNGMGKMLLTALKQQDYFVVLAMNMFYIVLSLASHLFLDLIYGFIDPRVKIN